MAESIVHLVLASFKDLIVEEAKLLGGVGGQIESLEAELQRMMSYLKDADARQHEGDGIHTWIKQVRNLAYRAQDVLEKYAIQLTSHKRSQVKNLLRKFAYISIHNVATEIETIKSEIINIRQSLQTYGMNPISEVELTKAANEKHRLLRQTFAHVRDVDFVGMHDDINNLVSLVVNINGPKIQSIYGMGGSGKTTMARNVFNHPQVQQDFDAFAWVCITQSCEKIVVLQDILKQLIKENVQSIDFAELERDMKQLTREKQSTTFAELVRDIVEVVQNKKCFVVLDDIWNIDDWKILSRAFVNSNSQSKVLITTRKYNVARVGFVHKQRLLDVEESLQLLQNKAFNNRNEHIDPHLEQLFGNIGRDMIRKCGGLPLAISALGGILRTKLSVKEWMDINKDIGSTLSQELDGLEDSETTAKVLALSYQDLPHFLKPCFLYMCFYREDEEIDPRKLYQLWIAEGMVSLGYLKTGETLMDVAERFLHELNLRCMVQLQMDRIEGKVESCKLHDLMRDLCLQKAKEEEFLDRIEIDFQGKKNSRIDTSIGDNAPRVVIDLKVSKSVEVFDLLTRHQFLRSFSLSGKHVYHWKASDAVKYKLLRVLDFENLKFYGKKLPNNIGELIHLRFLSLFKCDVKELPSSVGDLIYLQTLDVRVRYYCQIPYDLGSKNKQLKHLYLGFFTIAGPYLSTKKLKLDGLSELESFVVWDDISKLDLKCMSRLVNIRCFKYFMTFYKNDSNWLVIMEQIKNWKKIQVLDINMDKGDDEEDTEEYTTKIFMSEKITHMSFTRCKLIFPSTYEPLFCQNLVSLDIHDCGHDDTLMEFAGKLPNLRLFRVNPGQRFKNINFTEMTFSQLKLLELSCKKLKINKGSLPNLITLKIGECEEIVPEDGLKYLHKLEELCLLKSEYVSELKDKCWRHHSQYAHISIKEVDSSHILHVTRLGF